MPAEYEQLYGDRAAGTIIGCARGSVPGIEVRTQHY